MRDDDHEHAGLVRGGEEGLGSSWGACGWMRSGPNAVKCLIHYHLRGWWCSGSVVWCWCCRRSATAHEIRCSSLRKLYLQVVQVAMRGLRWSSPLAGRLVRAGPLLACLLHDWLSCTTGCDAWLRRAPRTGAPAGWLLGSAVGEQGWWDGPRCGAARATAGRRVAAATDQHAVRISLRWCGKRGRGATEGTASAARPYRQAGTKADRQLTAG
eukprot:COSAG01_NODE_19657_length_997_cov_9.677060_1_plen_212_part_00